MNDDKIVYQRGQYIVKQVDNGHIVYNRFGKFDDYHTHIYRLETCISLIDMIYRNRVPDSPYLRKSCLRICMDKKYLSMVENKIDKDRNKLKYTNPQKGVNRRKKK